MGDVVSGRNDKGKTNSGGVTRRRFLALGAMGAALLHTPKVLAGQAKTGASRAAAAARGVRARFATHGSPAVIQRTSGIRGAPLGAAFQSAEARPASPMGRMFPSLPAHNPTDTAIKNLSKAIPALPNENPDNAGIRAGFTFFGQFIDHDVTFDASSVLTGQNDPNS